MRLLVASVALFCALTSLHLAAAPLRAAEEAFPYTAYVIADDVYVRSGPGKNYYPTNKLQNGEAVEVYRHDPGGWYAIRPPAGSFSWVAGSYVKPVENSIAEISGDRVVSRVGSEFSDIRDVIQVRLYRGEEVEVLESKRFGEGPAAQTWCKISPPSGEFRWVYGKLVDEEPPGAEDRSDETRQNLLISAVESGRAESNAGRASEDVTIPAPGTVQQAAAQRHSRRTDPAEDDNADAERYVESSPREERSLREAPSFAREPEPADDGFASTVPFDDEVEEIDLELSMMVAEEPTVWTFEGLRGRAESLLARAETAVERGRARHLLNRMARFEDIRDRYTTIANVTAETDRFQRHLVEATRAQQAQTGDPVADNRFDGTGRLTRVVSSRLGAPRYALLDSAGNVAYYVTPSPGVNLQYYTGREVGLSGNLGYLPDLDAQHLTAKRIQVLDDRRLR